MTSKSSPPLLELRHTTLRQDDGASFEEINWAWQRGEQWAILSPNHPGKTMFLQALLGKMPPASGELFWNIPLPDKSGKGACRGPEESIAFVSAQTQQELIHRESSFYQSRWNSGIGEGERTVAELLSQESVENINPFEIDPPKSNAAHFLRKQKTIVKWLGIGDLLNRKIILLSNGEQRKVLLAEALLRNPGLIVLDEPFDGLDPRMRQRLASILERAAKRGSLLLLAASRPDEIPAFVTHILLTDGQRVIAQGPRQDMLLHPYAQNLAKAHGGCRKNISPNRRKPAASIHRKNAKSSPVIELRGVTIQAGRKRILNQVSWVVNQDENWVLLGHNGAGKTTLLSLIQCDHPLAYAQDIRVLGMRYNEPNAFRSIRNRIAGFSPELHQHYPGEWTGLEAVGSGFYDSIGLFEPLSRRQRMEALSWLDVFQLKSVSDEPIGTLTPGDRRLVLLARAMVKKPAIVILDEPCQGLDAAHRQTVLNSIDSLLAHARASLIMTTHHSSELPRCVTHALRLKSGRVMESGPIDPD